MLTDGRSHSHEQHTESGKLRRPVARPVRRLRRHPGRSHLARLGRNVSAQHPHLWEERPTAGRPALRHRLRHRQRARDLRPADARPVVGRGAGLGPGGRTADGRCCSARRAPHSACRRSWSREEWGAGESGGSGHIDAIPPLLCHGVGDAVTVPALEPRRPPHVPLAGGPRHPASVASGAEILVWAAVRGRPARPPPPRCGYRFFLPPIRMLRSTTSHASSIG